MSSTVTANELLEQCRNVVDIQASSSRVLVSLDGQWLVNVLYAIPGDPGMVAVAIADYRGRFLRNSDGGLIIGITPGVVEICYG